MVCDRLRKGSHCVSDRNVKHLAEEWRAGSLWIQQNLFYFFTHISTLENLNCGKVPTSTYYHSVYYKIMSQNPHTHTHIYSIHTLYIYIYNQHALLSTGLKCAALQPEVLSSASSRHTGRCEDQRTPSSKTSSKFGSFRGRDSKWIRNEPIEEWLHCSVSQSQQRDLMWFLSH